MDIHIHGKPFGHGKLMIILKGVFCFVIQYLLILLIFTLVHILRV